MPGTERLDSRFSANQKTNIALVIFVLFITFYISGSVSLVVFAGIERHINGGCEATCAPSSVVSCSREVVICSSRLVRRDYLEIVQ